MRFSTFFLFRQFSKGLLGLLVCLIVCLFQPGFAQDFQETSLVYAKQLKGKVIEELETGFVFEVTNENPINIPLDDYRTEYVSWVALPPNGSYRYSMRSAQWYIYWKNGETEGPFEMDEKSSVGDLPVTMRESNGSGIDLFRTVNLAPMKVIITSNTSRRVNEFEQGNIIVKSAVYEVIMDGDLAGLEVLDAETVDPYFSDLASEMILNDRQALRFSAPLAPLERLGDYESWNKIINAGEEDVVLSARILPSAGFYKITPLDLAKSGVNLAKINIENLRVYANGKELPVLVEGGKVGSFVGDTTLLFYVPASEVKRQEWTSLWLVHPKQVLGDSQGKPLRVELKIVEDVSGLSPKNVFMSTVRIFEPKEFSPRVTFQQENGRWLTGSIPYQQIRDYPFKLANVDVASSGTLKLVIMGPQTTMNQAFRVGINGVELQKEQLIGSGPFERSIIIPENVLRENTNTLNIEYPQTLEKDFAPVLLFSFAEISYRCNPTSLPFNNVISIQPLSTDDVVIRSEQQSALGSRFVIDLTNESVPVYYRTNSITLERKYYNSLLLSGSTGTNKFLFTGNAWAKSLSNFSIHSPQNLLMPSEGADILVIAEQRFLGAMDRYKKRREAEGYRVEIVDVQQVFNTFGMGQKSDRSIYEFLRHAFQSWPVPRLHAVLFVGEASEYWYQLSHPNPDISENMIPIFGFASPHEEIRGDAAYGWVSGSKELMDLEIGRFSVTNEEELIRVIDRIVEYEDSPEKSPWLQRHLFFTDDEPEFARLANRVIGAELNQGVESVRLFLQEQPYEEYFRIRDRKRSFSMTQGIIAQMNEGALTATYVGHGGPNLWSGERIFHYRDLSELNNNGRRPIMTAASCDTAWVDYPVEPVRRSIGEQFITNKQGGGIALYAPVSGTNSYEHDFLLRPFFDALSNRNFERLGKVTLYSSLNYMLYRQQSYVPKQYILLGDPALKIPKPEKGISAEISPAAGVSNRETNFVLTGKVPSIEWGTVTVTLYDPWGYSCGIPQRVVLENHGFSVELTTPEYKRAGKYRLLIQAFNAAEKTFVYAEQPIEIHEPKISLDWAVTPAAENNLFQVGVPVALTLNTSNATPVLVEGVKLKIVDANSSKVLTETQLSLDPLASRVFEFKFPVPQGITLISAELSYSTPDEVEKVVSSSLVEIRGVDETLASIAVPTKLVNIIRKGDTDQTTFEIPLYNLSGNSLVGLSAELFLMDRPEGSLVGEIVTSPSIAPFGSTKITILENVIFPSSKLVFELRAKWKIEGKVDEDFITQNIPLSISIENVMDAAVVAGSVKTIGKDYRKSETIYVEALIKNNGTEPISDLRTGLYVRFPWDKESIASSVNEQSVVRFTTPLAPGETRPVRLRWDPKSDDPVSTRLYVITNDLRESFEVDFSNNVADLAVAMRRLPNLRLLEKETTVLPKTIMRGEMVTINAAFMNDSVYDFPHPFIVEINAESETKGTQLIYRTKIDGLMAGEKGYVQANWNSDEAYKKIYFSVNEEREFGEETSEDNVIRKELDYVFPLESVLVGNTWKFSELFDSSTLINSTMTIGNTITIQPFPKKGDQTKFSNEFNPGKPLPTNRFGSNTDNMMLIDGGVLSWTPEETPEPASFRFPMSDQDDTLLYDVYLWQIREEQLESKPTNYYRYKIELEEWKDAPRNKGNFLYLGRHDTRDDYLDLSFAPGEIPSFCTFYNLLIVPVRGEFISSKINLESFPGGHFEAKHSAPGKATVQYYYRLAPVITEETPWIAMELGEKLSAINDSMQIQIKGVLIADQDGYPAIEEVIFIPTLDNQVAKIATDQKAKE